MAVVVVGVQSFQWISGEDHIHSWEKPGHDWQKNFCVSCASPLPGPNDANTMFIPAGLIDQGHENLRVVHHIWVASKAAWDEIGDDGQQHPRAFHQ